MKPTAPQLRSLGLALAAGLGFAALSALPAEAHGSASGHFHGGVIHPLLGLDHLLLLVGVGTVASYLGWQLLAYALGGAVVGALMGANGIGLPLAELLAALSVSLLGFLVLQASRSGQPVALPFSGGLVALAVGVHGLLHGQAASGDAGWWLGALVASTAVVGVTYLSLHKLGLVWTLRLALGLTVAGFLLALGPIGLLAGGAGV